MQARATARWRIKGPEMEGAVARWYAKVRSSGSQIEEYRKQAAQLTEGLPAGAKVLEVAPGPGYLAVEIARLGFQVTALDISRTFVQIGSENASQAGVTVDFRQGDAAVMPFEAVMAHPPNERHDRAKVNEAVREGLRLGPLRPAGSEDQYGVPKATE